MARTQVEKYSTAAKSKLEKPRIEKTNDMTSSKRGGSSEDSGSTHSDDSDSGRRSKVATSMRKFLSDDDDEDYLNKLTSNHTRKKSTSKMKGIPENSAQRRSTISPKSKLTKGKSSRRTSSRNVRNDTYEGNLNDGKAKESAKTLMRSARKLLDKAARAASPGRLRRDRSKSPGRSKSKGSVRGRRSSSPHSSNTDPASPASSMTRNKHRSKSPGRLKKKEGSADFDRSTRSKNRSQSPGRLKARSKSPGKLKKRSQSPGALRKNRPRRRPGNGEEQDGSLDRQMDRKSDHSKSSKRRGVRSVDAATRKRREEGVEGEAPLKEDKSYSNMQDELNRYKVKRNKSMDTAMAMQARRDAANVDDDDDSGDEDKIPPRRAESMMLSREMGRRGKSNSLADLVQYKEDEIHSTSYFASNHVLINRERMKRGLRPLTRNIAMDKLARESAESMASSSGLKALPTTYVGNVLRGDTIRSIHRSTMLQKQGRERANILNPYFQDFGVGTCKGGDGMLYMCQLFSERLELALTDTAPE